MHPAYSVILFTTASGAGYGLLALLGLTGAMHGPASSLAFALVALVRTRAGKSAHATLVAIGLFGAALLYGDGMITPAISVLSAVEGLEVATPVLSPYVVPITVVILIGLFSIQKFGTDRVGKLFGPIVIIWFLTLAALGARQASERIGHVRRRIGVDELPHTLARRCRTRTRGGGSCWSCRCTIRSPR